jgi:hypothetical protein
MRFNRGDRVYVKEFDTNGTVLGEWDEYGDAVLVTLDKPAFNNIRILGCFKVGLVSLEPEKKT